jgi:cation diffusion facilitator CzcD-associated flavoprotein CzcO
MKSVLVVGAGPAGLLAAKSLLQQDEGNEGKAFGVTVFDPADRLGGMWRHSPGEGGDKCSPDMRTNLSRFNVTFPDLAWQSVNLHDPTAQQSTMSGGTHPETILLQYLLGHGKLVIIFKLAQKCSNSVLLSS